jgi:hypothetical protein
VSLVPLERRVARTQKARCDSNGTVVRGLGFSECGPPISSLFFRNVTQNFSNLSLPRYPSRNPTNPVGLPSIQNQAIPEPILRAYCTRREIHAFTLQHAPTQSGCGSVWSSRGRPIGNVFDETRKWHGIPWTRRHETCAKVWNG